MESPVWSTGNNEWADLVQQQPQQPQPQLMQGFNQTQHHQLYSPAMSRSVSKPNLYSAPPELVWGMFSPHRKADVPTTPGRYVHGSPSSFVTKPVVSPAASVSSFSTVSTDFTECTDHAMVTRGLDFNGEISETLVDLSFLN
jgi:hypothetical protein